MDKSAEELFYKFLDDRCTEAEIRLLLEHFRIRDNKKLLKRLILHELEQVSEPAIAPYDVEERLDNIYGRVIDRIEVQPKPVFNKWYRLSAAATILLVVTAGLFYFVNSSESEMLADDSTSIEPGQNQAILTLADGKKILLHESEDGGVIEQNGVRITKTADGQVVYNLSDSQSGESVKMEFNTIEAPVGGQWQVILPDSSHVWLNALSSLTYPTRFVGNERKVQLKGEAYFEVAPNRSMPFKVETKGQSLEVLGTQFNVMAYDDEPLTQTTLLEGSVQVSTGIASLLLTPGEQAEVKDELIKINTDVDLEEVVAWKNGYFKFNDDLETILSKVARWYNVEVIYENMPDPNDRFVGRISRTRNLDEVLKIMEYTGKVDFTIKERRIIVTK